MVIVKNNVSIPKSNKFEVGDLYYVKDSPELIFIVASAYTSSSTLFSLVNINAGYTYNLLQKNIDDIAGDDESYFVKIDKNITITINE